MPKKRKKVSLSESIPKIKRVVETRELPGPGHVWHVQTALYSPQTEIYASLCEDLINYALVKSPAVLKIRRRIKDDVQIVTVWYTDTHRAIYHIEAF